MATIGLVAMSAKPFHAGHDAIIRLASHECDEVHLYVSTSDRAKSGEVLITGVDMAMLWKTTIEQTMPSNVTVTYGGSPIGNIWEELGIANETKSSDEFVIYSDPVDTVQNFQERLLTKYCGDLYASGHVRLRPVDRESTVEISGTKMRELLKIGDRTRFMSYLPDGVDKELIWNTLLHSANQLPKVGGSKKKLPARKS